MAQTKVIIIGAGIAGPVLALFLKLRGYAPVVYERLDGIPEAGISLVLQPNGLDILRKLPGFVESIPGRQIERLASYSVMPEDPGLLGQSDLPARMFAESKHGMKGVSRVAFHRAIVAAAEAQGIEVIWGHELVGLEQTADTVRATFANGTTEEGSFVVGCDGLHSRTRTELFGQEKADYNGTTQTGGLSPTPQVLLEKATILNIFGNGAHMISYPVSETHSSWAVTLPEAEHRESWRSLHKEQIEAFQKSPFASWGYGAGELIRTTEKLIKYGLYDRPELKSWHKGRITLLGDAAHPTSPHLGQGASQAFEDILLLTTLLDQRNADRGPLDVAALSGIFAEYERERIPRSSALVKGARAQGEGRSMEGVEACKQRNAKLREMMKDDESFAKAYAHLYDYIMPQHHD
ncbi:FAD/NAD(P)-binding domain-containing protein [Artomyces pyxidatus]|uniref:FAD/NAD(P)-binding domain-containing protein n=1 Tax=Artomyces pyxidatus TaxID=48021 RepID=A0ACB8T7I4_9AGAM|nr:FAD/NAD(P)-binding domain-containing protein [Artomyces pyxidatus]